MLNIEDYDGEPNDVLLESEFYVRLMPNQGAFDAVKALREHYNGGE